MDDLKKYLQQNREGLDTDAPRDQVWQQVRMQSKKKRPVSFFVMRYAAAAAVLFLLIFSVKWMTNTNTVAKPAETAGKSPATTEPKVKLPEVTQSQPEVTLVKDQGEKYVPQKAHNASMYELVNALGRSYAEVVQLQLKTIRKTALYVDDPAYFDVFKSELKKMDGAELSIRNVINKKGPNDMMLEQLINVYQRKLDLLKTLRAEIKKVNDKAKQFQVPADSTRTFYLDI